MRKTVAALLLLSGLGCGGGATGKGGPASGPSTPLHDPVPDCYARTTGLSGVAPTDVATAVRIFAAAVAACGGQEADIRQYSRSLKRSSK